MKVRYYADPEIREWRDRAVELLETVHVEYDISIEIDHVAERYGSITDFPGNVRQEAPQLVYERDFKNNDALLEVIERRPSRIYKQSGTPDIAGNVAVVDNTDTVRWASTLPGYADGYGPEARLQTAMDFLEDIAQSPSNRICIDCLYVLSGDELFCPSCGVELPQ
jgi:hypothetical protein